MHLWKIQIPPPPCPHKLKKKVGDGKFPKFINMIRHLSVNIPYVEALEKMPGYAKFMKDLPRNKRAMCFDLCYNALNYNTIDTRSLI